MIYGLLAAIATLRGVPLVVLLDDERGAEAQRRLVAGQDVDDGGASRGLGVGPLERVGRPDPPSVARREVAIRGEPPLR